MKIKHIGVHVIKTELDVPFAFSQGWVNQRAATLIEIIKCMGVSEIKAKLSGGEPKHFRFAFNRYLDVFLNDLK